MLLLILPGIICEDLFSTDDASAAGKKIRIAASVVLERKMTWKFLRTVS
jgi:hypothetical protein